MAQPRHDHPNDRGDFDAVVERRGGRTQQGGGERLVTEHELQLLGLEEGPGFRGRACWFPTYTWGTSTSPGEFDG